MAYSVELQLVVEGETVPHLKLLNERFQENDLMEWAETICHSKQLKFTADGYSISVKPDLLALQQDWLGSGKHVQVAGATYSGTKATVRWHVQPAIWPAAHAVEVQGQPSKKGRGPEQTWQKAAKKLIASFIPRNEHGTFVMVSLGGMPRPIALCLHKTLCTACLVTWTAL